jgi:hypothetical protein
LVLLHAQLLRRERAKGSLVWSEQPTGAQVSCPAGSLAPRLADHLRGYGPGPLALKILPWAGGPNDEARGSAEVEVKSGPLGPGPGF